MTETGDVRCQVSDRRQETGTFPSQRDRRQRNAIKVNPEQLIAGPIIDFATKSRRNGSNESGYHLQLHKNGQGFLYSGLFVILIIEMWLFRKVGGDWQLTQNIDNILINSMIHWSPPAQSSIAHFESNCLINPSITRHWFQIISDSLFRNAHKALLSADVTIHNRVLNVPYPGLRVVAPCGGEE